MGHLKWTNDTYSNFILSEFHCQKHTMPSAPVVARCREEPNADGENCRDRKKNPFKHKKSSELIVPADFLVKNLIEV